MAELILADFFAELHEPEPDQDWADWLTIYARQLHTAMEHELWQKLIRRGARSSRVSNEH